MDPTGLLSLSVELSAFGVEGGVSIDDDGDVGASFGMTSGTGYGGFIGVSSGDVNEGCYSETSGCYGYACGSLSGSGDVTVGAGLGGGLEYSASYTEEIL